MYQIITTSGTVLGTVENVRYIRRNSISGSLVQAEKAEATGIALQGEPYNLLGQDEVGGADTVIIVEVDGGQKVADVETRAEDLAAQIDYLAMMTDVELDPDADTEETEDTEETDDE